MPTTPSRGYTYPTTSSPATVPADLRVPLEQIDSDVQTMMDRIEARDRYVVTHAGDGSWRVTTGLGEFVPIHDAGDGTYQIGA